LRFKNQEDDNDAVAATTTPEFSSVTSQRDNIYGAVQMPLSEHEYGQFPTSNNVNNDYEACDDALVF